MGTQTLLTIADVKQAGELTSSAHDNRIRLLIASVLAAAESYCRRKFSMDTFTEYKDIQHSTPSIQVDNPPWVSITSLVDDFPDGNRTIDATVNVVTAQEYKDRGEVRLYEGESTFAGGVISVKVVYVGGWSASTFPVELKDTLCQEVLFRLNNSERVGIASQSADGASVSYATRNGFAVEVCDVLDHYRQWHRCL